MPDPRHLTNAPISEAIIDVRVKLRSSADARDLANAAEAIAERYPQRQQLLVREFQFAFAPDAENLLSRRRGPTGYRLRSEDGLRIVQFRLDGFTFSRLQPYLTWEDLRDSARELWSVYTTHLPPEKIVRVAVRYINHISLPLPIENLQELLAAPPVLPADWSATLTGFLYRVGLRDDPTGDEALVTQTIDRGNEPTEVVYLLDIDAFSAVVQEDSEGVWESLERLRGLKNRIFFNALTERLLERFE